VLTAHAAPHHHRLPGKQLQEMEAVVRQSQTYAQTLQNYNTSLQTDVQVGGQGGRACRITPAHAWTLCPAAARAVCMSCTASVR
jgi:hypothetical protein